MRTVYSYLIALISGIICYPLLFHSPLFESARVFFYRGIILAVLCSALQLLLNFLLLRVKLLRLDLGIRDLICACALTFSFNITFLIVFPVTFQRSVSTFLLAQLETKQETGLSKEDMEILLKEEYLLKGAAVSRRMQEQLITGNVTQVGDRFYLSSQGRNFMKSKNLVEKLYGISSQP